MSSELIHRSQNQVFHFMPFILKQACCGLAVAIMGA